ncbi:MAG: hypothetical protein ACR2JN_13740, partial [Lapillicoccus sp.]
MAIGTRSTRAARAGDAVEGPVRGGIQHGVAVHGGDPLSLVREAAGLVGRERAGGLQVRQHLLGPGQLGGQAGGVDDGRAAVGDVGGELHVLRAQLPPVGRDECHRAQPLAVDEQGEQQVG